MGRKEALLVGASGLLGTNLLDHLDDLEDWNVTTLSRRRPESGKRVPHVGLDLLDRRRCLDELPKLTSVTHVFFCPRTVEARYVIRIGPNVEMLTNLLDGLEPVADSLRHVQLVHGLKWYGSHLGPFSTPAEERQPRLSANDTFYYEQQDLVERRRQGRGWSWSSVRPHFICGVATGSPSNLVSVIGSYAAVLRELGMPLSFPGPEAAWRARLTYTDVRLLTRAMVWAATSPRCANEAFNVVNGDEFRWSDVWPSIAAHYSMPPGGVEPMRLAEFMSDKEPVWSAVVRRHGLAPRRLEEVADWAFGDSVFRLAWDQTASVAKARAYGFGESVDTHTMFMRVLTEYRRLKILP